MQADIDFATDARRRGAAPAFAARMHPDGLLISPGDPVAFGPEAVAVALSGGQSEWHWTPLDARVSGDLGVTWGIAAIGWRDAQGQRQSVQTRYVTVWRRHAGEWRIWIDIGNPGPLP